MLIAFLDSDRVDGCSVSLEIPRFGSWCWSESKKNSLRRLRSRAQDILRPQETAGTRSFLRGYARVSRCGVRGSGVPPMWSCEAGEAALACRQSAIVPAASFRNCALTLPEPYRIALLSGPVP